MASWILPKKEHWDNYPRVRFFGTIQDTTNFFEIFWTLVQFLCAEKIRFGVHTNVWFIKIRTTHYMLTVIVTVLWLFWQILTSNCKFLVPRPLKWGILGVGKIILSKDIHNYILCVVRIFINQTLKLKEKYISWLAAYLRSKGLFILESFSLWLKSSKRCAKLLLSSIHLSIDIMLEGQ